MKIYHTRLHSWPYNSKKNYNYFSRDLSRDVFQCSVQMCGHPSLARIAEGRGAMHKQTTMVQMGCRVCKQPVWAEARAQPSSSSANNMDVDSDSDTTDAELYDLRSLLEGQSGGSRAASDNELPGLPADIDALRAELTPIAWINNPSASPQHVHVPDNYSPATPIYSPTSPDYSPSQSPIHVDSEIVRMRRSTAFLLILTQIWPLLLGPVICLIYKM